MPGKVPPPLAVNAIKIRVLQQSGCPWKPRGTVLLVVVLSFGFHGEKSQAYRDYSRKPGFTETRLRPLARRRDSTARPLFVFIRVRNP
jgi:hypothetical protein